jgi:hypothetical protein
VLPLPVAFTRVDRRLAQILHDYGCEPVFRSPKRVDFAALGVRLDSGTDSLRPRNPTLSAMLAVGKIRANELLLRADRDLAGTKELVCGTKRAAGLSTHVHYLAALEFDRHILVLIENFFAEIRPRSRHPQTPVPPQRKTYRL